MMFEERSTKQSGGKGGKLPEPVRYSPPRLPPPPPKKEEAPNGYNGRKTPKDDDDDRNDRNSRDDRDDRREGKKSRDPSKERTSRAPSRNEEEPKRRSRNEEEPKRRSRTPSKERSPSSVTRAEDIADSDFDPRRPRYMDDQNRPSQPPLYNNKDRNYPRDPKDYLIGGIYGPQPKTKPTEPNNGRSTATRRSRSYPRASSKEDDDDDYDDNDNVGKQNGAGRGKQELRRDAAGGRNSNNGGTRAFSLIDLKTGDDGKSPTGAAAAKHGTRARGRGALSDPERPSDRSRSDDEAIAGKKNLNREQQRRKQPPPRRVDNRPAWVNHQSVQQDHPETFHVNSKARLITFYKNGDVFFPGVKVSLRLGKDFGSLEALYNYLTQRTDLPNGVRYVFGLDGRRVRRLDELEDGSSYVCSSRKKFQRIPYGSSRNDWKPHSKFENQADLKLFRDPLGGSIVGTLGSPGTKTVAGAVMAPGGGGGKTERKSPETQAQQGSKEGRVIRVINAQDPSIQSRIILNLRTSQPWENVLEDLGEALRMPGAKKLFTTSGHEVQSFSQLRNDFRDVDTFYLSNANSKPRPTDDDFYLYNNVAKPARGGANNSEQPRRGRAPRPNVPGRPGSAPPSARARELEISERTNATRGRERDRGRSRNGSNAKNNQPKSISPMREAEGLLDPVRVKVNGQRRELYAPLQHKMIRDESPPDKTMQLNWVYPWQREMQQMNERPDFRF